MFQRFITLVSLLAAFALFSGVSSCSKQEETLFARE
jgi:hypothetical protein